ncbi:MAG: SPOR domain-containing protein [Gammaproteobacteria bacterium]|nr:SPOR domain-containing protein [Gammaproteobacteria bacterium]
MTPYVIDQQKQNQIAILLIVLLAVSFALGYAFGFQNAKIDMSDTIAQAQEKIVIPDDATQGKESTASVDIPEQVETSVNKDSTAAGKKTRPAVVKKEVTTGTGKKQPVVKKQTIVAKPVKLPAEKPPVVKAKPIVKPKPEVVNKPVAPEIIPPVPVVSAIQEQEDSVATQATDKSQRYSIQAGMFEGRDNALKFIDELKTSGFEAYLRDFVSSSGSVKYNVRVGDFDERQQVEETLVTFKQKFTSPAYIVINK